MRIGYVGVGNMGGALAARLLERHDVMVFDASAEAMARLTAAGATPAAGCAAVAEACDVVFLCLPTSDHVRRAVFGDDGLAGHLRPGTLLIDQTTGDPNATRAMAAELAVKGVDLIDAPVSGGIAGAKAGTIAIMVGGSEALHARALPLLRDISPNVFHAGPVGGGHVIKLVNNLMSCAQRLLTMEAVALAQKNGVAPRTAVDILNAGGGRNAYLDKMMGPRIIAGKLNVGFTLGLAHKDLRLACQLGIDSGVPMFFGNVARELYQMCIAHVGADNQVDAAALVFDRLAGTDVVPADNDLGLSKLGVK